MCQQMLSSPIFILFKLESCRFGSDVETSNKQGAGPADLYCGIGNFLQMDTNGPFLLNGEVPMSLLLNRDQQGCERSYLSVLCCSPLFSFQQRQLSDKNLQ